MKKKLEKILKSIILPKETGGIVLSSGNTLKMKYPDMEDFELEIIQRVLPFTMTSVERLYAVIQATKNIVYNKIPGDVVECGVWRGGSMMAIAFTFIALKDCSRKLFLFDTFEGMSKPTLEDIGYDGRNAIDIYKKKLDDESSNQTWCYASIDDVKLNMEKTNYPSDKVFYVKGLVEDTLNDKANIPDTISILRLDTDWYESTKQELRVLYPVLKRGGFLIIDDYGHWKGAKKATDEFFAEIEIHPFLNRIDYTARLFQK